MNIRSILIKWTKRPSIICNKNIEKGCWKGLSSLFLKTWFPFYSRQEVDKNYQVNQIKFYGVKVVIAKYL